MKMRKLFTSLSAGLLLSLSMGLTALASGAVIDDGADLLSSYEEESLLENAKSLALSRSLDLKLVTTDNAEGKSTRDYAEDYYMDHYAQDDGIVYLIDMDNREIYMATSGETIDYLADDRMDSILDSAYERITNGDYKGTFQVMLDGTERAYASGLEQNHHRVDEQNGEISESVAKEEKSKSPIGAIIGVIAGLFTGGGFFRSTKAKYEMKAGGYEYDWRGHNKADIRVAEDRLVNQFITQRRIPRNPPPSSGPSGHSSGGSTIHTGSGGHTFGGGGRKF